MKKNKRYLLYTLVLAGLIFVLALINMVSAEEVNYIYFDLAAGNVDINNSTYTGYIYDRENGNSKVTVTGTHHESNRYYIYQSCSYNTSFDEHGVPQYEAVTYDNKSWGDYITNNTDITGIIDAWDSAVSGKRTPTMNLINIKVSGKRCDLTLDNIWATYQKRGASGETPRSGLNVYKGSTLGTHVLVRLKGDNRFGSIHYYTGSLLTKDGSTLAFTSDAGNGSSLGTLTVIGSQSLTNSNGNYTAVPGSSNNVMTNHWDSVIGGSDSTDHVRGLHFYGGTIYAGSTPRENCTTIGGGGNGMGQVTITGGRVTAVAHTTGTAIGGGIAHTSYGGDSDVLISGGKVYAYNFGQPAYEVVSNFGTSDKAVIAAAKHIAGTAIGGGSSILSSGNQNAAKVTITGGEVYAQSLGGCAIGGGNSVNTTAGSANVVISGGVVHAQSTSETNYQGIEGYDVKSSVAIGGGRGGINGNGGNATVTISNNAVVYAGSIGGGGTISTKSTNNIGFAEVTVSGGSVQGQIIMAGGASKGCTFKMTGGTIDNKDHLYTFVQDKGGAVYIDDNNGVATISGGTIKNCDALQGGAVYMTAGKFNMSGDAKITDCTALQEGGAVYLGGGTFTMTGGLLNNNISSTEGGAVFVTGGEVTIGQANCTADSHPVITNNYAQNGGAFYIEERTPVMYCGTIQSNHADVNGGGICVESGGFDLYDGNIIGNTASIGGGVYVHGGSVNMTDGSVSGNTASIGGGIAVNGGNVTIRDGNVDNNRATAGAGGGIYAASEGNDVSILITSGSVSGNTAFADGGAVAVLGDKNDTENITVTIGLNENHKLADCQHNSENADYKDCPVIENNRSGASGGACYITGSINARLNLFCLTENNNACESDGGLSNFLMVEGGKVILTTSKNIEADNQDDNHGNAIIHNTIHIVGGQMDMYGSTLNPRTEGDITVEVQEVNNDDAAKNDYYWDHRFNIDENNKIYKVHYFENFKADGGAAIGRYTAIFIPQNTNHAIRSGMYYRPGYVILGWNTDPDGNGIEYKINDVYYFDQNEDVLVNQVKGFDTENDVLVLYAIWSQNSYSVIFDANVPNGMHYDGSMAEQGFLYNVPQALSKNMFSRKGYNFLGWSHDKDATVATYQDEYLIEESLTTVDGAKITLYAVWEECTHPEHSITYTAQDNIITKTCSCNGFTETATVTATDTVYNGTVQKTGTVQYSGANWGIAITYMEDDTVVDPINAGTYKACITIGGVTAYTTYFIDKASQPAPGQPTYNVTAQEDINSIVVLLPGNIDTTKDVEYQIAYIDNNGFLVDQDWQASNIFELNISHTTYFVYIRYAESQNYYPSDRTIADAGYYFESNKVAIFIRNGDGVIAYPTQIKENDEVKYYAVVVVPNSGYYIPENIGLTIEATYEKENITYVRIDNDGKFTYAVSGIHVPPDGSGIATNVITITTGNARLIPSISAKIDPDEVFGSVVGTPTVISRDSAFTVNYRIENYNIYDYSNPKIVFSAALPKDTTIIFVDKINNTYWYKNISASTSTINLVGFIKMGTASTYYQITGATQEYQFIIDFSDVDAGEVIPNFLSVQLQVTTATSNGAPDIFTDESNTKVSTDIATVTFDIMDKTGDVSNDVERLTNTVNVKYAVSNVANIVSSKWNGRKAALVLTPTSSIPLDSTIEFTEGNTTVVLNIVNGYFIIPLQYTNSDVYITLKSQLFPENGGTFTFKCELYSSESMAGKAPENGELMDTIDTLTFVKVKDTTPSAGFREIDTTKQVLKATELIEIGVMTKNTPVDRYTVTVTIMYKNPNGGYSSTAQSTTVAPPQNSDSINTNIRFALTTYSAGSYCLLLEVKEPTGYSVVATPYYFIIEE